MTTLKQLLWKRWGTAQHPAEWDGREGGGPGSQRFWEYLWTIDQIGSPQSVLDVGGGETQFFANLLSEIVPDVSIVDPLVEPAPGRYRMNLEEFVFQGKARTYDKITCVSVLEHIDDKERFCAALDKLAAPIVLTFELGPGCIEMPEMYRALKQFRQHHIAKMEACPVLADNSAIDKWRPLGIVLEPNP